MGVAEHQIFTDLNTEKLIHALTFLDGHGYSMIHTGVGNPKFIQQVIDSHFLFQTALRADGTAGVNLRVNINATHNDSSFELLNITEASNGHPMKHNLECKRNLSI